MSIFATPKNVIRPKVSDVMFLHGLEGSTNGSKAAYLKKKYEATVPALRTGDIKNLAELKGQSGWLDVNRKKIDKALEKPFNDAKDAYKYANPKVIIGSSMRGAILMKLLNSGVIDNKQTYCIFLAPAVAELVGFEDNSICPNSSWLFGESDFIIDKKLNFEIAKRSMGNIAFSPGDNHRLSLALESGLIDSAIVTAFESLPSSTSAVI